MCVGLSILFHIIYSKKINLKLNCPIFIKKNCLNYNGVEIESSAKNAVKSRLNNTYLLIN